MVKEFKCNNYKCAIDMTVDEAIKVVDEFLKRNISGQMPLDTLADRFAIEICLEELKQLKGEYK